MEAAAPRGLPAAGEPREDDRAGQLEAALGHLERLFGRLERAEQQFKRLTDECEGVLHGLVAVDRRHSAAIASLNERLGDWCNLEGKLLEESARRIERFERGVSHEWMVLRRLNEEPIAELREQADALRRTCLEAARIARLRLEGAEQARASHAEDIDRRLAEWTRQLLQAAQRQGSDAAALGTPRPAAGVEPWSFEGVAQLHQELRGGAPRPEAAETGGNGAGRDGREPSVTAPRSSRSQADHAGTDERLALDQPQEQPGEQPLEEERRSGSLGRRTWFVALGGVALAALLVVLVLGTGGPGTPNAASPPSREAAERQAAEAPPPPPAVPEPDARVLEAQRAAERAAVMVEILAAPDLRRYALGGLRATPAAYAQVLWSRTRGLAVTASRLPAPPPNTAYQVWIRNAAGAASAGLLTPDANGRASLVLAGPLKLPQPGAIRVTIEPQAGSPHPTGELCLAGGPSE